VSVVGDKNDVAHRMASDMLAEIESGGHAGSPATLIVPVGPVDHYPILASMINQRGIDCREVMFIAMDEYLTDDDQWLEADHPLSFRRYLARKFYDLLDPALAPPADHRIVPDPQQPESVQQRIDERGGVDACFGGFGINGHMAFNEPPEAGEPIDNAAFAELPTRVLSLSRETRTINANTVGGEISIVPRRAITVGMKQILAARRTRFYCNRPWQSAVVRRVLHGEITAASPASMLRRHDDAALALADYVAAPPDIQLR